MDALLFDIDGTLVDSTRAVVRSWRAFAKLWGMDAEALLAVCHGRRSEDTLADFLPTEQVPEAAEMLVGLELDNLYDVIPLPAARTLLESLPPGRWAAVTSGPRKLMTARLAEAGCRAGSAVTAEDVEAGKPDPQGHLLAAKRLGFEAARCLVIEDAPRRGRGLNAGVRAGGGDVAPGGGTGGRPRGGSGFELLRRDG